MRSCINIIDKHTIEVKGHKYTSDDHGLVYAMCCLVREFDDLKVEYDRLVELHQKVVGIESTDGNAYVMTFFDLANRIEINRQQLMMIASRPEFDKYRTYITKPKKHPAFIVSKNSLKLLYKYLNEKSRIQFSEQKFRTLLRGIIDGYTC
jgi:hypothetical protein